MKKSFMIFDDFCSEIEQVRKSSLDAGFGSWRPATAAIGDTTYDGMNFAGDHDLILRSLTKALGQPIFPRAMFFRVTTPSTKTYIHSDASHGDYTCITYLSRHKEKSGTGFYRHRRTSMTEMPPIEELVFRDDFDDLKKDMGPGGDAAWQQTDFVQGVYNRALIFHAPLFHSRVSEVPDLSDETGRLVHVCHYYL